MDFDFNTLLKKNECQSNSRAAIKPSRIPIVTSGTTLRRETQLNARKSNRLSTFDGIRNLPRIPTAVKTAPTVSRVEHLRKSLEILQGQKKIQEATNKVKIAGPSRYVAPVAKPSNNTSMATGGRVTRSQARSKQSFAPPMATFEPPKSLKVAPRYGLQTAMSNNITHKFKPIIANSKHTTNDVTSQIVSESRTRQVTQPVNKVTKASTLTEPKTTRNTVTQAKSSSLNQGKISKFTKNTLTSSSSTESEPTLTEPKTTRNTVTQAKSSSLNQGKIARFTKNTLTSSSSTESEPTLTEPKTTRNTVTQAKSSSLNQGKIAKLPKNTLTSSSSTESEPTLTEPKTTRNTVTQAKSSSLNQGKIARFTKNTLTSSSSTESEPTLTEPKTTRNTVTQAKSSSLNQGKIAKLPKNTLTSSSSTESEPTVPKKGKLTKKITLTSSSSTESEPTVPKKGKLTKKNTLTSSSSTESEPTVPKKGNTNVKMPQTKAKNEKTTTLTHSSTSNNSDCEPPVTKRILRSANTNSNTSTKNKPPQRQTKVSAEPLMSIKTTKAIATQASSNLNKKSKLTVTRSLSSEAEPPPTRSQRFKKTNQNITEKIDKTSNSGKENGITKDITTQACSSKSNQTMPELTATLTELNKLPEKNEPNWKSLKDITPKPIAYSNSSESKEDSNSSCDKVDERLRSFRNAHTTSSHLTSIDENRVDSESSPEEEFRTPLSSISDPTGILDEMESVDHFRQQHASAIEHIMAKCIEWELMSQQNLPEFVQELILSAVGHGRLLVSSKMQQFASLIERCANREVGVKPVTPADLQGFWDMVFMQVENIYIKFKNLDMLRDRNWIEKDPVKTKIAPKMAAKPPPGPDPVKKRLPSSTLSLREKIAANRRAMKEQQSQPSPVKTTTMSNDDATAVHREVAGSNPGRTSSDIAQSCAFQRD